MFSAWWFNKVEKNERILKTYLNSDNVRRFTKRDFKNVKDVRVIIFIFL